MKENLGFFVFISIPILLQPDSHCSGDERLLQRAFSNIIGNVFYSQEKADVIIRLYDNS